MKTKIFTLFVALLATSTLWAYDFKSGDLYYNITSSSEPYTVEVTYEQLPSNNYAGLLIATIPETVTYNGTTYSVTSIGDYAFVICSSLTSITIPNSVTSIGGSAFYGCSSLTSITIPNSVTSIGSSAFYNSGIYNDESNWENDVLYIDNCLIDAKESISGAYTIKENTRLIAGSAFSSCSSLTSITIPNSVTSIGSSAFSGCTSITTPVYNAHCFAYMPTSYKGAYIIPDGIKQIAGGAFSRCSSLTSITIPNSVTSIENYTFYECSSLTSVTIPNSVTSIGNWAFYECSSLTSITIPNSVTSIGEEAFAKCSSLSSITIPNSVTSIGNWAFENCSSLVTVYVEASTPPALGSTAFTSSPYCYIPCGTTAAYKASDWASFMSEFEEHIFYSTSGVHGDNITWNYADGKLSLVGTGRIADMTCYYWDLLIDSISEIEIAQGITYIPEYAFADCKKLTKVSLPASLEEIAANAFAGCSRLYDIYCFATLPPLAETSSFTNYNADVYIPCESQRNYQKDMVWGLFPYLQCISSEEVEGTEDVVINAGSTTVVITWPTEDNADNYAIVIEKDGEVFCTLTFNADGQLLNIAFAPARNGDNRPVQYAEQAVSGYRFTVTGLTEATRYAYNVTTKDAANKTIATYSGEFTTMGGITTTVEDILHSTTNCQKLLRNGQLLILRDGKAYNVVGQIVE